MPQNVVLSNIRSSDDLGWYLNREILKKGDSVGKIVVPTNDEGRYTIATQVDLGNRTVLELGPCDYDNPPGGVVVTGPPNIGSFSAPLFLMGNECHVRGSGWLTRIYEPRVSGSGPLSVAIVFANRLSRPTPMGGSNGFGESGLVVEDLHISGAATVTNANAGAVDFGNVSRARVRRCWFADVSGYAVSFGGGADPNNLGWAHDVEASDNVIERAASQGLAVTNADSFQLERNRLRQCGVRGNVSTYIDVELNNWPGQGIIFSVCGNTIDGRMRVGGQTSAGNGIDVSAAWAPTKEIESTQRLVRIGRICENLIVGGDENSQVDGWGFHSGIWCNAVGNVLILGNVIDHCNGPGVGLVSCEHVTVSSNKISNSGFRGGASVVLDGDSSSGTGRGCRGVVVEQNHLYSDGYVANSGYPVGITEVHPACDYNLIQRNVLRQLPVVDMYGGGYSSMDYAPLVRVLGKNSRHYGNVINGFPTDDVVVWSVDDLRAAPPPCAIMGDTGANFFVRVGNMSGRWNPTDTRPDNGVDVIQSGMMMLPYGQPSPAPGRWNLTGSL